MQNRQARKSAGLLALTLMLSIGFPPALLAAEPSVSIYQKLGEYEQLLFGSTQGTLPIEKRLQNLEKQLFGKIEKKGDTGTRVAAIDKVMNGKESSTYLPPMAPGLDRSQFAPEPKQAPENAAVDNNAISRVEDAPPAADSSDRIKGLLRQAMQLYSQGKTAEAEKVYKTVISIDFRNTDANYNLGAIAESNGDLSAAQRYYSAAAKSSPQDADIQDALATVQNKLRSKPAQPSTPMTAPSRHEIANTGTTTAADKQVAAEASAAYRNGQFDQAIQKLGYLARKSPLDANIQFALGQAYRGKGNQQEALRHLRAASTLNPKNDLYLKTLNDAQSQMDQQQEQTASGGDTIDSPTYDVAKSAPGPTGEITPFAGLPSSNGGDEFNNSDIENYMRRNGAMSGSVSAFGNRGGFGGLGGAMAGFGIPVGTGTAPGGTRLRRVVQSGIAGAAMGAFAGRGAPGGMSRGAMRGGMTGALYGLMLGGF